MRNSVSVITGSPHKHPVWCQVLGHHSMLPRLTVPSVTEAPPHLECDTHWACRDPSKKAIPSEMLLLPLTPGPRDSSLLGGELLLSTQQTTPGTGTCKFSYLVGIERREKEMENSHKSTLKPIVVPSSISLFLGI